MKKMILAATLAVFTVAVFLGAKSRVSAAEVENTDDIIPSVEVTVGTESMIEIPLIIIADEEPVVTAEEATAMPEEQLGVTPLAETTAVPEPVLLTSTSPEELDLLARIVQAEAGSDFIPFEEKVCTALTVLHRCDSADFPETISGNIKKSGAYTTPARAATEQNALAAQVAVMAWENGVSYELLPSNMLYFYGDGRHNHFHDNHGNKYELPW